MGLAGIFRNIALISTILISLFSAFAFALGQQAYVLNQGSNNVVIVNTATNTVSGALTTTGFGLSSGGSFTIAVSPSGYFGYIPDYNNNRIDVFDTEQNKITSSFSLSTAQWAAFSPSGTFGYATDWGLGRVYIVNTVTNTVTGTYISTIPSPISGRFTPNGAEAYVANRQSGSYDVKIISTSSNTVTNTITWGGFSSPYDVAISNDGSFGYVTNLGGSNGGNVVIISTVTNTVTGVITGGFDFPEGVAFSPDGSYAYVTNDGSSNVVIIDTATNTITGAITVGFSNPYGVAFSPFTTQIYVAPIISTSSCPSNTIVDVGQYESCTATAALGTTPYTYNFFVVNSVSTGTVANSVSRVNSLTSNTFTWYVGSSDQSNSPEEANVVLTDSNTVATTVNTVYSGTFTINPALTSVSLSLSNTVMSAGQFSTLSATVIGGSSPYIANFVISNAVTKKAVNSILITSASPSKTMYFPSWYDGNTLQANVVIKDSATANSIANSIYTSITLYPPPTLTVPSSEFISTYSGIITATCQSGDTCQIWYAGAQQATGTSTATLDANSLPVGYTALYANDITLGGVSATQTVRRLALSANVLITITNSQGSAIAADTPIPITFNALAYQSYESNSLNNTVMYFGNGTVAHSWIEGNALDEQQTANTLYTSNEVLVWFKSPDTNSYLAAGASNTIYMGFAEASSSLLDGNYIGEAAQLNCANPASTSACVPVGGALGYGQYDDGSSVFTYYQNFAGSSCPLRWTCSSTTVSNSLSQAAYGYAVTTTDYGLNANQILDFEGKFSLATTGANAGGGYMASPYYNIGGEGANWEVNSGDCANNYVCAEIWNTSSSQTSHASTSATGYHVWSIYLPSTSGNFFYDYQGNVITLAGSSLPTSTLPIGFSNDQSPGQNAIGPFNWIRLRAYLPGGVAPSSSFGTVGGTLSVNISSSPSLPASLSSGQSVTFNAIATGGSGSYTAYSFIVYNSATGIEVGNLLTTSNGFVYIIPSGEEGNTLVANVLATDSNGDTANSVNSGVLTVSAVTTTTTATTTINSCSAGCVHGSGGTGDYGTTPPTTSSTSSSTSSSTTVQTTAASTLSTTVPQLTTIPPPPIEVTVTPAGSTTPQLCNGTATGYSITFTSLGTTFQVSPGTSDCFTITATNATKVVNTSNNSQLKPILAVNLTISSKNISVNSTMHYPCSLPSTNVAPLILKDGLWKPITPFTVNAAACTVAFSVPSDPVIAIFQTAYANSQTTTVITSTAIQGTQQTSGGTAFIPIAVVAIIAIILAAYYLISRRKGRKS